MAIRVLVKGLFLGLLVPLFACAHRSPGDFGAVQPVIDPYSRNPIVCVPTGLGNVVGGLPGTLALAPFGLVELDEHKTTERIAGYLTGALVVLPAVFVGGAFGTPFLPFSYLADENPCHWI